MIMQSAATISHGQTTVSSMYLNWWRCIQFTDRSIVTEVQIAVHSLFGSRDAEPSSMDVCSDGLWPMAHGLVLWRVALSR